MQLGSGHSLPQTGDAIAELKVPASEILDARYIQWDTTSSCVGIQRLR